VTNLLNLKTAKFQVKKIDVTIDRETGRISVENDGDGIDIVKHAEENIYVPELIFGHLLTSSNYDDTEDRIVGGQNGIGAKACNIFSKEFTVETVDASSGLKYVQTFRDNMSVRELPKIVKCAKKPYTRITFLPDYQRFHCKNLSDDMYALFVRRCFDLCALTDKDVNISMNSQKLNIKTFDK
jgi:DNA topoisomerase-2